MNDETGDRPGRGQGPEKLSGEDARQGEIILRKRWQKIVFFGGLVGIVLFMLLAPLFMRG